MFMKYVQMTKIPDTTGQNLLPFRKAILWPTTYTLIDA